VSVLADGGPRPAWLRRAGRARRVVWQAAQVLDPARFALRPAPAGARVALVCVYRASNAGNVRRLVAHLPPTSVVRLWSLDGDRPADLAPLTVGDGPGSRFALFNRLVAEVPPAVRTDALVLADDDVRFVVGDLGRLLGTARAAGLDVYQPAHTALSHANWAFVRRRALTLLRRTDFVEQGPLVVFSRRAQDVLLPLPEDMGMAWGVEARWWDAGRRHGLIQGIVDAVAVQHLVPAAGAYDRSEQEDVLAGELARLGLTDVRQLQHTRETIGLARSRRR